MLLTLLLIPLNMRGKGAKEHPFTVVIDAGHGGKDIGATDNGAREKDINLGVALQLESILKKKMKDVKVVMTRDNDTYLTLQQRADVANKAKGDLFISIHTNSVDKSNKNRKTVKGSSVYALGLHKDDNNMRVARRENSVIELEKNFEQKYSGFDPGKDESYIIFEMAQKKNLSKSLKFAEEVQKELVGIGRSNRGVHQAGFWVLWATSMPSVLIELDFICNPTSAKYMTSEKGARQFAEAIYKAVDKYHESWSRSAGAVAAVRPEKWTDQAYDDSEVTTATQASPAEKSSKVKRKKSGSDRRNATSRRRRRNDASRATSGQRDYETAAIPLHSESEREGAKVRIDAESSVGGGDVYAGLTEKERKKLEKQAKKAQKEREKQAKKEAKKKRKANAHNAKRGKVVTVYKIQILASADLLKQNNPRFCGLTPISTYKENNLYKYYYGESTDRGEMEELLKTVRKKIPDAFVVSSRKSSH